MATTPFELPAELPIAVATELLSKFGLTLTSRAIENGLVRYWDKTLPYGAGAVLTVRKGHISGIDLLDALLTLGVTAREFQEELRRLAD